jgi:hypothetical protein
MKNEQHCVKPMLCGVWGCAVASVLPTLQSLQPNSSNMGIADVDKGWNVEAKWNITRWG